MDGSRFDTLARSLTAAGSRRQTLLALAGSLGLLSLVQRDAAEAKKKKCPPCKKRKQGKCNGKKPDGTACLGGTCQNGRCVACGAGGPCRVFLSSLRYDGNLKGSAATGLEGADAKCQGLAAAAGLPGSYKAWLSDNTSSPISRFVPSSGPYRLVNGTTIAANWADLTDGQLLSAINVTETGGGVGDNPGVWTHTRSTGTAGGTLNQHCQGWSSNVGSMDPLVGKGDVGLATLSNSFWTDDAGVTQCSFPQYLYCFQQS